MKHAKSVLLCILCLTLLCFSQFSAYAEQEEELFKSSPQRIVVFPLFAEEILYELVEPERIVYVGHQYDEAGVGYWPTMSVSRDAAGADWAMSDNEEIRSLHPDLVILDSDLERDYDDIFPFLVEEEISLLFLDTPSSIDEIADLMLLLGNALHEQEKACRMVAQLYSSMDYISTLVAEIPENEKKTVALYGEPSNFFQIVTDACRIYGLYCPDKKALLDVDPDIIVILPSCSESGHLFAIGKDYIDESIAMLTSDPSIAHLKAISSNSIYAVNFHGSQYVSDSAMQLLNITYPDLSKYGAE